MMQNYIIMMDVSGDVAKETIQKWDLKFIPMQYSLGEEMRTSVGPEEEEVLKRFYDGQRNGDLTKTSQITPYQYEEYFEPYLKEGYSILYLCLSSGLSSTYSAACLAKESLKEKYPELDVFPIDTLCATGGMGVLAEVALKNREKGLTAEENRDELLRLVPKMKNWFLVQDLMYLKRGGRVSAATAVVGSMLNIKPILKIDEQGKLTTIAKKRGNKMAVQTLFDYFKEHYNSEEDQTVYLCDANCRDLSDSLAAKVKASYPAVEIKQTTLSPIIGAHTGPGMLIISQIGK
ncbi:MAG: DegV family protein [Anaeroplasmataceae bacterium]|nr:DegV family protein [Anaeroplasmataceae bacterium]